MQIRQLINLTLFCGDAAMAVLAFFTGLVLRLGYSGAKAEFAKTHLITLILFVFILLIVSYILESYEIGRHRQKRDIITIILISAFISFILLSTLFFLVPSYGIGRGALIASFSAFVVYQFLWHILFMVFFDHPYLSEKIIVLGTGPMAAKIDEFLRKSQENCNITLAGYVACESEKGLMVVPEEKLIGNASDLMDIAVREKASKIIVALSERRGVFPLREVLNCKLKGIEIVDSPAFYEQALGKLMVESMTPSWIIFSPGFKRSTLLSAIKRGTDVSLALIGMAFSLPLFPIVALLVKLDSPGPIFFSQVRVGNREEEFVLYKFRTMCQNAECGTGAVWAQQDDPRIGTIGKYLRKFRLDELPQLYNVFRGDMSFVGPRPERPEFVAKLKEVIPFYSKRHFVKPGITGWAQVRFPYGASVDDAVEKLRYDLYYIKNMSPLMDTIIVLQTFKVVLFGRGGR